MKRTLKNLFACIALGALLALPAMSQSLELGISGGYGVLTDNTIGVISSIESAAQDEIKLSNGIRIGARMAVNTRRFIGHEVSYSYQNANLSASSQESGEQEYGGVRAHHTYYNLVLHGTPRGSAIRPFVTSGGGFSSFHPPGISALSGGGSTKFGYNYGGGVKLNFFKHGIRFDWRNHVTGKPFDQLLPGIEGQMNNLEITMTFSFLF